MGVHPARLVMLGIQLLHRIAVLPAGYGKFFASVKCANACFECFCPPDFVKISKDAGVVVLQTLGTTQVKSNPQNGSNSLAGA